MTNVVSMFEKNNEKVKIVSENEFTKHYKYEEKEIDCYLSKAYDEQTDKHFLVASIPKIQELSAMHIQFPMLFENEAERNEHFQTFNALLFIEGLLEQMKIQIEKAKEDAEHNAKLEITDDIQIITEEEAVLPELIEHKKEENE